MSGVVLRDYQVECVDLLRAGIAAGIRKQVLAAPTGSGKTEIACHMLGSAEKKTTRALFIVDRVVLVDQTSARLDMYGIPHGVIQAGHWRFNAAEQIQVCSAQTLERRGIPENVQVVFVDEAHGLRKKITEFLENTNAVVIGLSATPFTKGMGQVYGGIVNVTTTNALIERGFLAPLKVYVAKAIDTKGMKVIAGEWSEHEIEIRGKEIIGDIVAEWVDKTNKHYGGPAKTIVFSATVAHGEELCRQFNAAGFNFQQISYKDGDDDHRRDLIAEFRKPDSTIHGLVSCEVFTKGFDVQDVLVGVSARPYRKSLSSHIQQMGRIMRSSPGKEHGLWLDHSGNYMRFHEDVEDIFANGVHELDDGKREEKAKSEPGDKERNEIRCTGCGFVFEKVETECPECGKERIRHGLVEQVAGEMVEVIGRSRNGTTKDWGVVEKLSFLAQLKGYAQMHGYKPGYAAMKYKEKFGDFPTHRIEQLAIEPPSPETLRWIKSRNIAFAKARRFA